MKNSSNSKWKIQFEIMWHNTPKKFRKNILQINLIKSQAKIYIAIWGKPEFE